MTSKKMLNILMFREKFRQIALLRKIKPGGLLLRAVYLTAADTLPEGTFYEKKVKYQQLCLLNCRCVNNSVFLRGELHDMYRLKREIEGKLGIELDDPKAIKVLEDSSFESGTSENVEESKSNGEKYLRKAKEFTKTENENL